MFLARSNTSTMMLSSGLAALALVRVASALRLLDRHRQGIEPTEYGRALLDFGVAVFDDLRQGVKSIEFLTDPTAGEVRIGCHHFLAASFVAAVIDRLCRRHPRIVFHVVAGQDEALHRELSERRVDFLIARSFGAIADERLGFEFLFADSFVVATDAQSPWVRRRRIELAELVNESWVLPPPESVIGSLAMEAFRASGLAYHRATVVTLTPEMRMSVLATGRFLTIFPASVMRFPTRRPEQGLAR